MAEGDRAQERLSADNAAQAQRIETLVAECEARDARLTALQSEFDDARQVHKADADTVDALQRELAEAIARAEERSQTIETLQAWRDS